MALTKINYVSGKTVITAENLNDIQDAILDLERKGGVGMGMPYNLPCSATNEGITERQKAHKSILRDAPNSNHERIAVRGEKKEGD